MYTAADFDSIKEQLKTVISEGKATCHKCHMPFGGADVQQIDLINSRVIYRCPNVGCSNHTKTGYRSFKAMGLMIPSIAPPADLVEVQAPEPQTPESVEWDEGEETIVDLGSDSDDESVGSMEIDINDPDSEE